MHHHQPLILNTKQAEPSTLLLFASLTHLPKPQLLSKPISFKFTATTTDGSVPDKAIHSGNGLAFVRVPDEFTIGRSRPWLGILNDACSHYKVFVVEFDTSYDPEFVILMRTTLESNLAMLFPSRLRIHQKLMFLFTILL